MSALRAWLRRSAPASSTPEIQNSTHRTHKRTMPPRRFGLRLLSVILGLAAALAAGTLVITSVSSKAAAQPAPEAGLVKLADVKTPGLLFKSLQDRRYVRAPLIASDIRVTVTGPVARAIFTQRFQNPAKGWVEGVYVFPLPGGAAVDKLKMVIGKRFIEGQVKERVEARVIYEKAKREGRKAALMEQQRPNMFTNAIANIGPGETIVIQIEYQQTISRDDDIYALRVPLVVAPRYTPKPSLHLVSGPGGDPDRLAVADPVPDRSAITPPIADPRNGKRNPVSLAIDLKPGFAFAEISSPFHKIAVERTSSASARISLADGLVPADRDFELVWKPAKVTSPDVALFKEAADNAHYILAVVTPPPAVSGDEPQSKLPRDVIFVIDNSGSMAGPSMRQAKQSLLFALDRLSPEDRFNIIRFDNTMDQLFATAQPATTGRVAMARTFVASLEANGGTEMLPALQAALIDTTPGATDRLRQVVFLTDGAIGNESQLFKEIVANRGRSRIFTVGIGSAPNSFFMTRAAMHGRGTFTHIGSVKQVEQKVKALLRKLEHPVVTDLEALWPGAAKAESWPNPLPDLYLGEPVVVTARLDSLDGELELTGMLNGKRWVRTLSFDKARDGRGVAKLWARRKIAALEGRRQSGRNMEAFDKSILQTALSHGLVSRLTSLVAIDVTPTRPADQTVVRAEVPLNLPAGWDFGKLFGPAATERAGLDQPALDKAARLIRTAAQQPATAKNGDRRRGMALPEGATPADRLMVTGALMVAFAIGLALLLMFWRHFHAAYAPRVRSRKRRS